MLSFRQLKAMGSTGPEKLGLPFAEANMLFFLPLLILRGSISLHFSFFFLGGGGLKQMEVGFRKASGSSPCRVNSFSGYKPRG